MGIRHVHFMDEKQASSMDGDATTAIISITDPDLPEAQLSESWANILRLSFNDAEYDHALIRTYDRVADFREQHCDDPQPKHASAIHRFLESMDQQGVERLAVHCRYGRSRSAAVAKYVIESLGTTVEGGSLEEYNRTLYLLLQNPMTFERVLQNMERAEASAQMEESSFFSAVASFTRKWFG